MADRRDPRFGGNMEVANTGIPYPTGGRDVRFEGSLPHQFQYRDQGRTVVSDTEPAFTDMGRNRNVPFNVPFDDSRREQAIMNQYQRPHVNPRMRHINPRGMNQTLSSLDSLTKKNRGLEGELSEIYKQQDRARMHPLFPSPGPWNEFDPVSSWANYDPNDPRAQAWENDQGGLESLQSKVDPSDWRTILRILEAGGDPGTETQTALNIGDTFPLEGHGRKRPYGGTRDMGPTYEELETIPLDLQFDQWGYPIGQDDFGYIGAARGGLMSLRR